MKQENDKKEIRKGRMSARERGMRLEIENGDNEIMENKEKIR